MDVLLVRHGIAEEDDWMLRTGSPDSARPLTKEGRVEMSEIARGLKAILKPIPMIVSSPFIRARETAEILRETFSADAVLTEPLLVPEAAPSESLPTLARISAATEFLCVVSHEPHLGYLISYALSGIHNSFMSVKKGSATLLKFPGSIRPGGGTLVWHLPPNCSKILGNG